MAKAGHPKNGSAKLPDWFDIENYRQPRSHDAAEWFQQFSFRKQLFDHYQIFQTSAQDGDDVCENLEMLEGKPEGTYEYEALDRWDEAASESWIQLCKLLWENTVITQELIMEASAYRKEDDEAIYVDINDANISVLNAIEICEKGVREVTNQEIYDAFRSFPDKTRSILANNSESFRGECLISRPGTISKDASDIYDFLNTVCDLPRVTLDYSLPNEILLAGVEDILNKKRKILGKVVSPFLRSPDFSDWYNGGVLPYLDLLLWENITGKPIYWSVFVNAMNKIADRPIGGESAFRKTTKGHAVKVMDARTIQILHSQAARERSVSCSPSSRPRTEVN